MSPIQSIFLCPPIPVLREGVRNSLNAITIFILPFFAINSNNCVSLLFKRLKELFRIKLYLIYDVLVCMCVILISFHIIKCVVRHIFDLCNDHIKLLKLANYFKALTYFEYLVCLSLIARASGVSRYEGRHFFLLRRLWRGPWYCFFTDVQVAGDNICIPSETLEKNFPRIIKLFKSLQLFLFMI